MKYINIKFLGLIITSIILSLNTLIVKAQNEEECGSVKNKKVRKMYDEAVDLFQHKRYLDVITLINQALDKEPEYGDALNILGESYVKRGNNKSAEKYFLKAIDICSDNYPYAYYYIGAFAYQNEDYERSQEYMKKFMKYAEKIKKDEDYKRAEKVLEMSNFYVDIYKHPVPFNPKLVKGISTELDEYLPIISADGEIALFTRAIEEKRPKTAWESSQKYYKEIFMYSKKNNTGEFDAGTPMPNPFNNNNNEGGATLTVDNKTLYYTICKTTSTNYYNCDLFCSENIDGEWSEIKNLGPKVNTAEYWESQPSVSGDGKTLYFASDRKGGYGGTDIYKIVKNDKGEWSEPINLGPEINTKGNEKSPFIHTDSQTLYYASDGLPGLGGFDIFFSRIDETGKWTKPKNIGYPINSKEDDLGMFVSTNGKIAYFASNKLHGAGGWDLYSFDLYRAARPVNVLFIKGDILDETKDSTKSAKIEIKNVASKHITEIPIGKDGKYVAALVMKDDFVMTVKKEGSVYSTKYFAKDDTLLTDEPQKVDLEVKPIKVGSTYKLNDIYFETNSFVIKKESKAVIDEFISFLNENPTITVVIQGHTDDVGNDQDNMTLSENRAKAVYDYLASNGINKKRLNYKGFGKTMPISSNQTEEGRAKNRRTEFLITRD